LIDDHPVVRQGLKMLLPQASHIVCGEAENKSETLERIEAASPDLVLLDISLGDESGLDLIAELRKLGILVLVYSMHEDGETIEKAFTAGANGYVSKREIEDVLFQAISDLLTSRRHVSPRAAQGIASKTLSTVEANAKDLLSERESDILTMLGRGESNADIAAALFISVRTVETYFSRIMAKLGLSGMKELRRYAIIHRA